MTNLSNTQGDTHHSNPIGSEELTKALDKFGQAVYEMAREQFASDATSVKLEQSGLHAGLCRNETERVLTAWRDKAVAEALDAQLSDTVNILENEKKQWLGDPPALDAINYVIESLAQPSKGDK